MITIWMQALLYHADVKIIYHARIKYSGVRSFIKPQLYSIYFSLFVFHILPFHTPSLVCTYYVCVYNLNTHIFTALEMFGGISKMVRSKSDQDLVAHRVYSVTNGVIHAAHIEGHISLLDGIIWFSLWDAATKSKCLQYVYSISRCLPMKHARFVWFAPFVSLLITAAIKRQRE